MKDIYHFCLTFEEFASHLQFMHETNMTECQSFLYLNLSFSLFQGSCGKVLWQVLGGGFSAI